MAGFVRRAIQPIVRGHRISEWSAAVLTLSVTTIFVSAVMGVAQSSSGQYDGEYYSEHYNYGFRIAGNEGTCTVSNAPTYVVGDVMFRFTVNQSGRFDGQQIFTDGQWYDVWGQFHQNSIAMRHGVMTWWDMEKIDLQIAPAPSLQATQFRDAFNANNGNQIVANILNDAFLWGATGPVCQLVGSTANGSLPSASAMLGFLDKLLVAAGSSGNELAMINFGRNANQKYKVSYAEASTAGWRVTGTNESEFHRTNIPFPNRVEKFVHNDGREYVFYDHPTKGPIQLNDGQNDGTFNFAVPTPLYSPTYLRSSLQHVVLDIFPWILLGATPEDNTDVNQRLNLFENSKRFQLFRDTVGRLCLSP